MTLGSKFTSLLDETRPRLQGSRLSAWELERLGVSYDIIPDTAAGFYMGKGEVDIILVGADRIAANCDFANKIGTYQLAIMAPRARHPLLHGGANINHRPGTCQRWRTGYQSSSVTQLK